MTSKASHKRTKTIQVGDTVGLTVAIVNKNREIIDHKVMVTGVVTGINQLRPGGRYRATIKPQDRVKWFLYSGKEDWAWLHEVVLVKRAKNGHRSKK